MTLFDTHRALLDGALAASAARACYWSPFPRTPRPKLMVKTAQTDGQAAVQALLEARTTHSNSPARRAALLPNAPPTA